VEYQNGQQLSGGAWYGGAAAFLYFNGTVFQFVACQSYTSPFYEGTDTSASANAVQVSTLSPANTLPSSGQVFVIQKNSQTNTGATTIQISGGTIYDVEYQNGAQLANGAWYGGAAAILYFNGTVFQFLACNAPALAGLKNVQVFTSSGTYTPAAGATYVFVYATGGGGAGGAGDGGQPGVGGGAGATAIYFGAAVSETVTIGAGGVPTNSSGYAGAGGTTSFGSLAVAGGGAGGYGDWNNGSGSAGGTSTAGTIQLGGAASVGAISNSAGPLGTSGASSFWGGAGLGIDANVPPGGIGYSQGGPGTAPGAGGGGTDVLSGSAAGGAGAPGIVVVMEF
jgi:hypothetical protein